MAAHPDDETEITGNLEGLVPAQVEAEAGSILHIPLVIHSATGQSVALKLKLPEGWQRSFHSYDHFDHYPIGAGGEYPVTINLQANGEPQKEFQKLPIMAIANGETIGLATIQANLIKDSGLPQ